MEYLIMGSITSLTLASQPGATRLKASPESVKVLSCIKNLLIAEPGFIYPHSLTNLKIGVISIGPVRHLNVSCLGPTLSREGLETHSPGWRVSGRRNSGHRTPLLWDPIAGAA